MLIGSTSVNHCPIAEKVCPDAQLEKACVYVRWLDEPNFWERRLIAVWETFDGKRGKAWFTHFSVLMQFDDGSRFIAERDQRSVNIRKLEPDSKTRGIKTTSWGPANGIVVTGKQVNEFIESERARKFCVLTNNCKHFSYELYDKVLGLQKQLNFFKWCSSAENEFLVSLAHLTTVTNANSTEITTTRPSISLNQSLRVFYNYLNWMSWVKPITKEVLRVQIVLNVKPSSQQDLEDDPTKDPITFLVMRDPVVARDGFTYDRATIEEWFSKHGSISPSTGASLADTTLISNQTVRALIAKLHPEVELKSRR